MKKLLISICTATLLVSCNKSTKSTDDNSLDKKFDQYKAGFVTALWEVYPGWASGVGYHKSDNVLVIPDDKDEKKQLDFAAAQLDSLKQYKIDDLSDKNKTDFYMIKNQMDGIIFSAKEMKSSQWNPSEYNVCGSFAEILNGSYDSLEVRLKAFNTKMNGIPLYYEAAKKNIKNPTIEHTELAIAQNLGGSSVFEGELTAALEKSKLTATEKKEILEKAKVSVKAIADYADWLKKLPNKTPRSFRLGAKLYAEKFDLDIQSGYNVDQIYKIAIDHKNDLHEKMFVLADKLWTKYNGTVPKPTDKLDVIKQVIDKISLQHTTPEKFQSEIEKQIPELTAYVKAKDLLYIDPSKPLVVRKEPAYMAGVAGASISAPGPYDKNANTYYNVGSMSGWTAENSESYLREYNDYILQILNIHEAIP
ncbi:MAG: DUF885 family protein, partial [Flavobacterium sp.]